MVNVQMFDVVLSGDPNRKQFFEYMKVLYSSYDLVNNVLLFFERNPAISFNRGARESKSDLLFCTADVYVPPETVKNMIGTILSNEADVIFILPSKCRGQNNSQFCSGAFAVNRQKLLSYPMPESPDFLEEILWQHSASASLKFKAYYGSFKHLHKHAFGHFFRFSRLRTKARAKLKNRGFIANFYVFIDLIDAFKCSVLELSMKDPNIMLRELICQHQKS